MILHTRGAAPVERARRRRRARARSRRSTRDLPILSAQPMARPDARRVHFLQPDRDDAVHLRRGRHGARGDGHLRAGVVHRQAEHARNRHPHGARRVGPVGRSPISRTRPAARRDWRGGRHRCGARRHQAPGSVLFGVSPTDAASFARALAIVLGGRAARDDRSGVARGADESADARCGISRHDRESE